MEYTIEVIPQSDWLCHVMIIRKPTPAPPEKKRHRKIIEASKRRNRK